MPPVSVTMQAMKFEAAEAVEDAEAEVDPPAEDSLPHAVIAVEMAAKPTITAVTRARCTEISHVNQCVWTLLEREQATEQVVRLGRQRDRCGRSLSLDLIVVGRDLEVSVP
jgi:hypothetical protein